MASEDRPELLRATPLVHPSITKCDRQLRIIGVPSLSGHEIIECLKDERWLDLQDLEWFAKLYQYLSDEYPSGQGWETYQEMRQMGLIPVEGCKRSNVEEQPIYFPSKDIHEIMEAHDQIESSRAIAFLASELYARLMDDQELIAWLTDALGVQELTLATYCYGLADALNRRSNQVSVSELVRVTAYIRDQWDDLDQESRDSISRTLPLALADGTVMERPRRSEEPELVMPEAMDPEAGWQLVFADADDREHLALVSDEYLSDCSDREQVEKWRAFFESLRVTVAPDPPLHTTRNRDVTTSYEDRLLHEFRTIFDEEYPRSRSWPRGETISNYRPPRWLSALSQEAESDETPTLRQQARALLHWLIAKRAQSTYSDPSFCHARYQGSYHGDRSYWRDSEFKWCLLNAPWFPSSQGLSRPSEVFLDRPELREMFGDDLPYAPPDVNEEMADWLELRKTATADELLAYLVKDLSSKPADQVDAKLVRKIYSFLSERWRPDLSQKFREDPLILVRDPEPKWVTTEQAVWPDLSDVFGGDEAFVYLDPEYGESFREFFVDKVGVPKRLNQELYATAWGQLAETGDIKPAAVEAALERIYPELLRIAKEDEHPDWWAEFCANTKVWTQSDCFDQPARVYVPDDSDLKSLFAKEGVEFAWRPEKASFADYEPLYQALGVESLVASVRTTIEERRAASEDDQDPLLTLAVKRAICQYLWNEMRALYEQSRENGALEALLNTRERRVNALTVYYDLDGTRAEVPESCAFWDQSEQLLYLSNAPDVGQIQVEVPMTLARDLTAGRPAAGLENFIGRILNAPEAVIESIGRKHNWTLPAGEGDWVNAQLVQPRLPEPAAAPMGVVDEPDAEPLADAATSAVSETDPMPQDDIRPAAQAGRTITGTRHRAGTGARRPTGARETTRADAAASGAGAVSRQPDYRLVSYVRTGGAESRESSDGHDASANREAVERAGIKAALAYEQEQGRFPEELERTHQGWDMESYTEDPVAAILGRPDSPELVRRIEVKATRDTWGVRGVGLTAPEYNAARRYGQEYFLYVVERALDESQRTLHVFQNPAGRVTDYRFDHGWRAAADETDP